MYGLQTKTGMEKTGSDIRITMHMQPLTLIRQTGEK